MAIYIKCLVIIISIHIGFVLTKNCEPNKHNYCYSTYNEKLVANQFSTKTPFPWKELRNKNMNYSVPSNKIT